MTATGCEETTWWVTRAFQDPDVQQELHRLRSSDASIECCTELLLSHLGPTASLALEELREFPSMTVPLLLDAWETARAAGVPFTVKSVHPNSVRQYARRKRITPTVTIEDAGVEVSIAHLAGRHASWLSPAVAGASAN